MQQHEFEQRIARAKEAARLASLAASARAGPSLLPTPPASQQLSFQGPPPPRPFPRPPLAATASSSSTVVPEDVRHRVERLVEFIQRNGAAFEETVRQRERDNPDFAFLHPHARFNDFYEWRKRQVCGPVGYQAPPQPSPYPPPFAAPTGGYGGVQAMRPPAMMAAPAAPTAGLLPTPGPPTMAPVSADALLSSMSVGTMASVCKLARKNGLAPYAPIPQELLWNTATLPNVEPARLEIRLAEFYR